MADPIVTKQFYLPVYNANGSGALITTGGTLNARRKNNIYNPTTGRVEVSLVAQAVTLTAANEDSTILSWAKSSANGYLDPDDIWDLDPDHSWNCPPPVNLSGTVDAAVTSITINGAATSINFALTAQGAADAQAWLNDYIHNTLGQPGAYATVVFDAVPTPDELNFYVNNFVGSVTVNSTALT